ncbi:MAG: TlpA disulfide reductase family protein, partial [Rhodanobacter sp.]
MRQPCTWMLGWLLTCSPACMAATPPIQPASPLASLLKMQAIDSTCTISYRDEHGKPMSENAFSASVAHGRSFGLKRVPSAHAAILSLEADGHEMKLSAKEIAAIKASRPGTKFLKPGQALPRFQLQTADGRGFDNATLRGHVTLVNFFFAACAPCIQETPTLTAYAEKYPQQHVLAVTFDDASTAKVYVADHGFNWPVLVDGMAFNKAMGVDTYPVMALIGPNGRLLKISLSAEIAREGQPLEVADLERWVGAAASSGR